MNDGCSSVRPIAQDVTSQQNDSEVLKQLRFDCVRGPLIRSQPTSGSVGADVGFADSQSNDKKIINKIEQGQVWVARGSEGGEKEGGVGTLE